MDVPSNIPWQIDEEWNQVLVSLQAIENKGKNRLTQLFSLPQYMVFPHFCPIQFVGQTCLP